VRSTLAALAAAALLLVGCGSEEETAEPAAPHDCGRYELAHDPPSEAEREQNRCLLEAIEAAEPATLVVTRATIEGDPITTTYHARDGGSVELVVDTTDDRYGPQAVSTLRCEGLREANGVLEGSGCEEAP
jgi:hypothetical protein